MARRWHPSEESDAVVFAACERFLKEVGRPFEQQVQMQNALAQTAIGDSEGQRADSPEPAPEDRATRLEKKGPATLAAEWLQRGWGKSDVKREQIYPLLWEAIRRGYLMLVPPREQTLARNIAYKYGISRYDRDQEAVQVIGTRGEPAHEHVANAGAELLLSLIKKTAKAKADRRLQPTVHLGLGSGSSAMRVAKRLAQLIRGDPECPDLVLHAISAVGFSIEDPTRAPTTYFRFFDDGIRHVRCVGLFCPTVVHSQDYESLKDMPGVNTSFRAAKEIDVIVTSLASARDPHGLLQEFLGTVIEDSEEEGEKGREAAKAAREHLGRLRRAGWVGELQFRPFSRNGPILLKSGIRAVTLFELDDLRRIVEQENKYLVLLSGPCRRCQRTRTDALWYLLTQPRLRCWSHLVVDLQTAGELLNLPADPAEEPFASE